MTVQNPEKRIIRKNIFQKTAEYKQSKHWNTFVLYVSSFLWHSITLSICCSFNASNIYLYISTQIHISRVWFHRGTTNANFVVEWHSKSGENNNKKSYISKKTSEYKQSNALVLDLSSFLRHSITLSIWHLNLLFVYLADYLAAAGERGKTEKPSENLLILIFLQEFTVMGYKGMRCGFLRMGVEANGPSSDGFRNPPLVCPPSVRNRDRQGRNDSRRTEIKMEFLMYCRICMLLLRCANIHPGREISTFQFLNKLSPVKVNEPWPIICFYIFTRISWDLR